MGWGILFPDGVNFSKVHFFKFEEIEKLKTWISKSSVTEISKDEVKDGPPSCS